MIAYVMIYLIRTLPDLIVLRLFFQGLKRMAKNKYI